MGPDNRSRGESAVDHFVQTIEGLLGNAAAVALEIGIHGTDPEIK